MTRNSDRDLAPTEPYSEEFCEREYNARRAVPGHREFFIAWASRSALARERLACYLDVAYGTGANETLDVFPAANPRGILVFIHGGYWRSLDKADFSFVAEPFVAQGIGVALINYALCPATDIARIVGQCERAIAWLNFNAARFGLAGPLLLSGHSAGAHLAAMMFTIDWQRHHAETQRLRGGLAISGIFDLEPLIHTTMNADLRLDSESVRRLSPVHLEPRGGVPLRLVAGGAESGEFLRQGRLLAGAWPGTCHEPLAVSGRHHFSIVDTLADPASETFRAAMALLA